MRENLKVGDSITTIGGINGRIVKLSDTSATIEVGSDRTKLTIERWGIGRKMKNNTKNITLKIS